MSLLDPPALAYAEVDNPWFSWQFIRQNSDTLLAALREHATLTVEAVLLAGLRLATVSTVALVTVGVLIGHGGLGQLILGGFRNNFYRAEIATATLMVVMLALVLDLILALTGRLLTPWTRRTR